MIKKRITIQLEPREDGGLRIWSDDIPGLVLSSANQRNALLDLGPTIIGIVLGDFRVGKYVADYSEVTEDQLNANQAELDELFKDSKVLLVKREP